MRRKLYSLRTDPAKSHDLPLGHALPLFESVYQDIQARGYFQEAFGYRCVDLGDVPGVCEPEMELFRLTRKRNLWPPDMRCRGYSEEDLFDVIEFLYDNVSKPVTGDFHSYANCGYHWKTFDKSAGQSEFREEINFYFFSRYCEPFSLSSEGEVFREPDLGLEPLLEVPEFTDQIVVERIRSAVAMFSRHNSTKDDRRAAVKYLADVLERLRPELRKILSRRDEDDLFNLANNFGIRHLNHGQKLEFDEDVWLPWMFYHFLATLHMAQRKMKQQSSQ